MREGRNKETKGNKSQLGLMCKRTRQREFREKVKAREKVKETSN